MTDFEVVNPGVLRRVVGGGVEADLAARCSAKKAGALASGTSDLLTELGPQKKETHGFTRLTAPSSDFNLLSAGVDGIRRAANQVEADCLKKGNALIQNPASGLPSLINQL